LSKVNETLNSNDEVKISELAKVIREKYGFYINHMLFWLSLAPIAQGGGVAPKSDSDLGVLIQSEFGSFDHFIK